MPTRRSAPSPPGTSINETTTATSQRYGLSPPDFGTTLGCSPSRQSARRKGWPDWINLPSKVAQVATLRAFGRGWDQNLERPEGVLINAVCPGWADTAARPYLANMPDVDAQTPDEAAVDLLWLATLPAGTTEPHGELLRHRQKLSFEGEA